MSNSVKDPTSGLSSKPHDGWRASLWGLGLAIVVVAAAAVLRWWLDRTFGHLDATFVTFYPAVLLVAMIAGGWAGIFATVLAAVTADYFFLPPFGFGVASTGSIVALSTFTCTGVLLSVVMERLRRARWDKAFGAAMELEAQELAAKNTLLAQQADELARQSEELTQQGEEMAQQNEELAQQNEEMSQQGEELAQQNEELQVQSEEIHALNTELAAREGMLQKLVDAARLSGDEGKVLKEICVTAREMFGPAALEVVAFERQGEQLLVRAQAGLSEHADRWPIAGSFEGLVMCEGRTACLQDTNLRPDLAVMVAPGQPSPQAILAAPMREGHEPFGVVAVYSGQKQEWTADQFRLAEWLAGQCGHIVETLRLQMALRQSEQHYRSLFENMIEGFAYCQIIPDDQGQPADFVYLDVNNAFYKLTGLKDVVGKSVSQVIPGLKESHPELFDVYARVATTGRPESFEIELKPLQAWLSVKAYSAQKGYFVAVFDNITDRKRADSDLRRTIDDLGRSNKELEQFAYVASHDLQEPLRMVEGFLGLLVERCGGALDEDGRQYVDFAVQGSKRMSQLVYSLLEYSRIQRRSLKCVAIPMSDVLHQAIANCHASIAESGAIVTGDGLPTVMGDGTQLLQLLQNLIGNAIKFRRDGVHPEVSVSARREKDHWLFCVRDNGIGIPADQAERVFLIFQRLHTQDQYPGAGIGLSICKKIVERHGGRIWVESQVGEGAAFYFTIPDYV